MVVGSMVDRREKNACFLVVVRHGQKVGRRSASLGALSFCLTVFLTLTFVLVAGLTLGLFASVLGNQGLAQGRTQSATSWQEQRLQASGKFVRLISLNPIANRWFLWIVEQQDQPVQILHWQNPFPEQRLVLNEHGLVLRHAVLSEKPVLCLAWSNQEAMQAKKHGMLSSPKADGSYPEWSELEKSLNSAEGAFVPFCGGRLYLRQRSRSKGSLSAQEWMTQFLRKDVFGEAGEELINLLKPYVVQFSQVKRSSYVSPDSLRSRYEFSEPVLPPWRSAQLRRAYAQEPQTAAEKTLQLIESFGFGLAGDAQASTQLKTFGPQPARTVLNKGLQIQRPELGIELDGDVGELIELGQWYQTAMYPDIFLSFMSYDRVHPDVLGKHKARLRPLTAGEEENLAYLMAFDLESFELHFSLGTRHPDLYPTKFELLDAAAATWRQQVEGGQQDAANSSRVDVQAPSALVTIGSVPPWHLRDAVAVFTGGFKSRHGRFRWGPHRGKSYGYAQAGVEVKALSPELATLYTDINGYSQLLSWPIDPVLQGILRSQMLSARQNGVLMLDEGKPTWYLKTWGAGNWSGNSRGELRSMRSAVCLVPKSGGSVARAGSRAQAGRHYLIYGFFSGATPSAMAKILESYGCSQAMHLDMNAYIHTLAALFRYERKQQNPGQKPGPETSAKSLGKGRAAQPQLDVQYLHPTMRFPKRSRYHRFITDNNQRDFFYLLRRSP